MFKPLVQTIALSGFVLLTAVPAAVTASADDAILQDQAIRCMALAPLSDYLADAFGEIRIASGANAEGRAVYLYRARSGSWTLVERTADGLGCIAAAGEKMHFDSEYLLPATGRPASG